MKNAAVAMLILLSIFQAAFAGSTEGPHKPELEDGEAWVEFKGGEVAMACAAVERNNDFVNLVVEDDQGKTVVRDRSLGLTFVKWTPKKTGKFKVKVFGGVGRGSTIAVN